MEDVSCWIQRREHCDLWVNFNSESAAWDFSREFLRFCTGEITYDKQEPLADIKFLRTGMADNVTIYIYRGHSIPNDPDWWRRAEPPRLVEAVAALCLSDLYNPGEWYIQSGASAFESAALGPTALGPTPFEPTQKLKT